jgi:hypothetical protein
MNDHDIETLLTSLSPARPSAALRQSVDTELEQDLSWARTPKRKAPHWFTPVMWSSLGAAAAVLVMSTMPVGEVSSANATLARASSMMPVSTIREVVDTQDEGIQYNDISRLPEQHVKLVSMERHTWIDPRDGAHITVEMPREDSVVLPVAFQ